MYKREDLPQPETVTDRYLAAILDELRSDKGLGSSKSPDSVIINVKEPIKASVAATDGWVK